MDTRSIVGTVLLAASGLAAAAEQYQVMIFGDPGVPGDAIYAYSETSRLEMSPHYALTDARNGVYVNFYADPSVRFSVGNEYDLYSFNIQLRDGGWCGVGTTNRYTRLVLTNGVMGGSGLISHEQLQAMIEFGREKCWSGHHDIEEFAIDAFAAGYKKDDGSFGFVQVLDALALDVDVCAPTNASVPTLTPTYSIAAGTVTAGAEVKGPCASASVSSTFTIQ
jgi:hypothetical protein